MFGCYWKATKDCCVLRWSHTAAIAALNSNSSSSQHHHHLHPRRRPRRGLTGWLTGICRCCRLQSSASRPSNTATSATSCSGDSSTTAISVKVRTKSRDGCPDRCPIVLGPKHGMDDLGIHLIKEREFGKLAILNNDAAAVSHYEQWCAWNTITLFVNK